MYGDSIVSRPIEFRRQPVLALVDIQKAVGMGMKLTWSQSGLLVRNAVRTWVLLRDETSDGEGMTTCHQSALAAGGSIDA